MKFTSAFVALVSVALSVSAPVRRRVDDSLVPEFGVESGVNPDGTGNCDGIAGPDGKPVLIPCDCPPSRQSFIDSLNANVAAGKAVNNPDVAVEFPEDDSVESQLARFNAATVTLQNLNGPGVGCPQAATTFGAQIKAIQDGTSPAGGASGGSNTTATSKPASASSAASSVPPAASSASAATTSSSATPSRTDTTKDTSVEDDLVPEFGIEAGVNPDGTGNCEGVAGPDGKPVLIPCTCPPERQSFIQSLQANVANGFAVNNPDVAVSFPTDDSVASQLARFQAATVTLQNLEGPGVGCPQAATTFSQQIKAIQGQ
ncbi:hypothetical protein CYLTODRAFT_452696 [Cylindrobasidium torrendii FP15055 ss-10]|uniref:Uncharacterized protein n=1 Tax=Cylindrobasidium torrendii FP15055 ss-10 TaxID=1314674 RepID=A0A0D7BGH0_9AGAR|nr:hypothetical protein CYLTODRAFT_452696 [Cylindrobasidium torrendii FP15055 ss-10]